MCFHTIFVDVSLTGPLQATSAQALSKIEKKLLMVCFEPSSG